ncbi:MAG: adenosylmethionine--8-amino-7-oxononanoate transaminase [Flavobacteriales bacterium]|nr:adenosylmethionine--8-amino-7-oxononanoate transaminase [Flavobacteriales bacterium]
MTAWFEDDKQYVWHPFTQAKLSDPPIPIVSGEGAWLIDKDGGRYLDAVASWWTNIHGHAHPYLAEKLAEQARKLEHVIFAGFTHQPAVDLAGRLLKRLPSNQSKIFYSDNGSTAVEVALKMAIQYWHNRGERRRKFIALRGAYHGDTFGAMSTSARGTFTQPFADMLFDVIFIDPPYPGTEEATMEQLRHQIEVNGDQVAAFIFEPLVLGTAGMYMYTPAALAAMMRMCRENGWLTIADEVMTGFGRTGTFFACDQVDENPDIVCMSKGLTAGMLPMGATSASDQIYQAFWSDDRSKTLFHGHSFTANPLGCAAGLASLDLFDQNNVMDDVQRIALNHATFRTKIRHHPLVKDCRHTGVIIAIEIETGLESSYFSALRDQLYRFFISQYVLLRPLGNIVYILPPYCISDFELGLLYQSIEECLDKLSVQIHNS